MTNLHPHHNQIAQDRIGLLVAARLSEATNDLPHDVSERLRAARVQALAKRKIRVQKLATSPVLAGEVALMNFGNEHFSGWSRLVAAIPLIALVLGLIAINIVQNDNRAIEIAEIDAALLTDDLPPTAYADEGFAHFLKQASGRLP